jgi:hypothetical protein
LRKKSRGKCIYEYKITKKELGEENTTKNYRKKWK